MGGRGLKERKRTRGRHAQRGRGKELKDEAGVEKQEFMGSMV